jgi:hypothetical protein
VAGSIFAIAHPTPVVIFILVLGTFEVVRRWRTHKWVDQSYYSIPPSTRVAIGSAYASVAVICLWGMSLAYVPR